MTRASDPVVFSTDRSHGRVCPACERHPCVCPAVAEFVPVGTVLRLRLDKKDRGGKAVTVVFDLPPQRDYFVRLLKTLKGHCGTGGALKADGMELQGDQRDKVQAYLERLGFTVRRSGG